jgi:putative acetyltransferase
MTNNVSIIEAVTDEQLEEIRVLFREYQSWLNIDLCFQDFEEELNTLPGYYASPLGRVYLVVDDKSGQSVGCVALRPVSQGKCEMKRLYIRDDWKRLGLGRELAELVIDEARQAGHSIMCLDTFNHLSAAIALYKSLGFSSVKTQRDNSKNDVCYMERALS